MSVTSERLPGRGYVWALESAIIGYQVKVGPCSWDFYCPACMPWSISARHMTTLFYSGVNHTRCKACDRILSRAYLGTYDVLPRLAGPDIWGEQPKCLEGGEHLWTLCGLPGRYDAAATTHVSIECVLCEGMASQFYVPVKGAQLFSSNEADYRLARVAVRCDYYPRKGEPHCKAIATRRRSHSSRFAATWQYSNKYYCTQHDPSRYPDAP